MPGIEWPRRKIKAWHHGRYPLQI